MIDLHCHYLPGIDDGARTLSESLALLKASAANGITEAVLTPHVHPGVYDNRLGTLRPAFDKFQAAATEAGIDVRLHLGGEVRLHPDALDLLAAGDLPLLGQLGDSRILLLEFPDGQIPVGALKACRFLVGQKIVPLIAHPERNKEVMRDPSRIEPFLDIGCLLQVTAASVIGRFGPQALRIAQELIERDWVAVVATDAHNLAHRPPLLREAREAIRLLYNQELADRLTTDTPRAIVAGR